MMQLSLPVLLPQHLHCLCWTAPRHVRSRAPQCPLPPANSCVLCGCHRTSGSPSACKAPRWRVREMSAASWTSETTLPATASLLLPHQRRGTWLWCIIVCSSAPLVVQCSSQVLASCGPRSSSKSDRSLCHISLPGRSRMYSTLMLTMKWLCATRYLVCTPATVSKCRRLETSATSVLQVRTATCSLMLLIHYHGAAARCGLRI